MGRAYETELNELSDTYQFAYQWVQDLDLAFFREIVSRPLIAIGSGGSFSAAQHAAVLHQSLTGHIAKAVTPLELLSLGPLSSKTTFLLVSAGGRNSDTLRAFEFLAGKDLDLVIVLTASPGSPVSVKSNSLSNFRSISLDLPWKDGFLATNSLLAFTTVLSVIYGQIAGRLTLPDTLDQLVTEQEKNCWRERSEVLLRRDTLVLIYDPLLLAGAVDVESKFTEAALGVVQLADFRQFAHGRHHWLAKKGDTSSVIFFVTSDTRIQAERLLKLLPSNVPADFLVFSGQTPSSSLKAVLASLLLAGLRGENCEVDPGRPGVPSFGRKIYNLSPGVKLRRGKEVWRSNVLVRKSEVMALSQNERELESSLKGFLTNLQQQTFSGLVCDYDGTLCDSSERFSSTPKQVAELFEQMLDRNIPVGIATGRGKSVRDSLRHSLDKRLWGDLIIGFYNGACVLALDEDTEPRSLEVHPETHALADHLRSNRLLMSLASCEIRPTQLSFSPLGNVGLIGLWQIISAGLGRFKAKGWRAYCSDHSIDVIPATVSKLNVVKEMRERFSFSSGTSILCVGDCGNYYGNDYELLSGPQSLSVAEVSASPESCWNLAAPGQRGMQAFLDYSKCFTMEEAAFRFDINSLATCRR